MQSSSVFGKGSGGAEERAEIVSTNGKTAEVYMQNGPGCDGCGSSGVCFPDEGGRSLINVENIANAKVGDVVSLETNPAVKISASMLVFGLPIALMILGAILGLSFANGSQDGAAVGAIAGVALGMLLVRFVNRFFTNKTSVMPKVISIISHNSN